VTDVFSKKKRSQIMARIRGSGTRPEKAVIKAIEALGGHYRVYVSELPGKPDIVLDDQRVAIFVNGCFWHGHDNCRRAHLPAENKEFWRKKLSGNKLRDRRNATALRREGWSVVTFWTCSEPTAKYVASRLSRVGVSAGRVPRRGKRYRA
jgi:DNA mismatch endonuclease (patch repair protein)